MNRRYFGAVAGAVIGSVVGATIGGLVGRGIALFGDETVESVVPMVFCAVLGYAIGGASGCKGSLERIGAKRSTSGAVVAGFLLIGSVIAAAGLGSDTAGVFLAILISGLVVAGLAAAAVAGPGRPKPPVAAVAAERAPKLEVTRQTVTSSAPEPAPEPSSAAEALAFLEADAENIAPDEPVGDAQPELEPAPVTKSPRPPRTQPLHARSKAAPVDPDPAPAPRPRRTRPLRAGDATEIE